ncbi:MAG: hypothetical protein LBC70_08300 [Chitinispirillales bacterium]|jgi:hypothetical protein|nr:hypothetical protein [Chitinispirillales bacterium]
MLAVKDFVSEIEGLSNENLELLEQIVFFMKYRDAMTLDDNTYLASIPGMMESIMEGADAPESECVPMEEIWPDV